MRRRILPDADLFLFVNLIAKRPTYANGRQLSQDPCLAGMLYCMVPAREVSKRGIIDEAGNGNREEILSLPKGF
jgi:hypothetical protein